MSLINDVLRDLERRESSKPQHPSAGELSSQLHERAVGDQDGSLRLAPVDEGHPKRNWILSSVGLAVALTAGGLWFQHAHAPAAVVAAAPAAPSEAPVIIAPIYPEPDPKAEVPELPTAAPAPKVVEPPKATQDQLAAAKPVIKAVAASAKAAPAPQAAAPVVAAAVPDKPAAPTQAPALPRAEQLLLQAQTELKQGQADAALNTLRAALEADPKHVQARLNLARLLAERKQLPAAADLLADGVMLLPQQNAFVLALAPLWFQSGQQDDALALLAQSAKQPAATPQLTSYYAAQLLRLKRHAEAIPQFRAALRSDPAQPDWLIGLGLALQGAGQNKEAIDAFRRAYETGKLNPDRKDLVEQMIAGLKSRI